MTITTKRMVVEVLLCSGPSPLPSCGQAAEHLGYDRNIAIRAVELWLDAFATVDGDYLEISTEAAYRVIESSPSLRREWWES